MSQEFTPEQLDRRAHHFENAGILDIAAMLRAYAATLRAEAFATVAASKPCPACGSRSPCADAEACGAATLRQPAARVDEGMVSAGNKMFSAMEMQERRETGAFHLSQPSARALWDEAKRAWQAALSAQPTPERQGEADLAGYVDPEQVAEMGRGGCAAVSIGSFSERYGRTVPVYFHPAAPVGVPDGWSAWHDDFARTWAVRSPTGDVCEVHDRAGDVHAEVLRQLAQTIAAAPTAPQGTQQGEG